MNVLACQTCVLTRQGNRRFSDFPIALPDMVRGITDWTHNATYAPLRDFDDTVQTDETAFPMRIGKWSNVSLSTPFAIGGMQFIALAVTETTDVCKRYLGCSTKYTELVVITKYNASLAKFEQHQRLLLDTSAVAIEHMHIENTNALNSARDYLAIANSEPLRGSNVNVYFWNSSTQLFVFRQTLSTDLPGSNRYVVGSPRSLKHFFVSDPGIHFLAVAFHFVQTSQSAAVFKTESYIYSWVQEGRTVMEDGTIDPGLGFQVFQLLRTNGASSFSHLQIPCDCQEAREKHAVEEVCVGPLDILTVTNSFVSVADGSGESSEARSAGAGAQIWRFRARFPNMDASMWRLHGNVGVFELLQSLHNEPTIASASFRIEQQGCFFAYLCRNSSLSLPAGAEWKGQGEIGGSIHLWEYKGGPAPRSCLKWNASDCAFARIQVAGRPSESKFSHLQTLGRSMPHQMSRGPYSCSSDSMGCIVGAQSLRHVKSSGEHYLVIAQSVCEPGMLQEGCNAKTEHGRLEVRSTVLQWDSDARQMGELLSITGSASRIYRSESIATSEERRLHSYPFRFPAGRAASFSTAQIPVGEGPTKRHDRTLLILASRTAGAILYDWEFPVISGLNGSSSVLSAIAGARYNTTFASMTPPADKRHASSAGANWRSAPNISLANALPHAPEYVYVLSQIDRALVTLEKREVLDMFGNIRSQLAISKIIQTQAQDTRPETTSRDLDLRGASSLRFVMVPHDQTSAGLANGNDIPFKPAIAAVTRAARGEKLCGPFAAGPCQSLQMSVENAPGQTCDMLAAMPHVTPNGTVVLETNADRIGTCTFQVVSHDSSSAQIPGPGVSSARTFSVTVRAVNDQPRFDVVDVHGQENARNQSLVFAVNVTPGVTLRSSQLRGLGEDSSGIRFHLIQTSCFIKVRLDSSWDHLSAAEIAARYEASRQIVTEGYVYEGPYVTCRAPEAQSLSDGGLLWRPGSEPKPRFVYSSDGMFGTVHFESQPNAIGFAEFQAVLIDDTEPSSAATGAINTSEVKMFRIWVEHTNEQPRFRPRVQHSEIFSPPSFVGSPLARQSVTQVSASEKQVFAVNYVSACSGHGDDVSGMLADLAFDNQTNLEFLVLEKLRLKSQCPADEREQRYLFHIVSLEAHSGNFAGSNRDLTRNGGDLFEPHTAEIRCELSALEDSRSEIAAQFEFEYLDAKRFNADPAVVAALKAKADSVFTIDLSTNITVVYPEIDILGLGGRWEAEEARLTEEYCSYCLGGLCMGYCLDGQDGCRGGTCKDKVDVTDGVVADRLQAVDVDGDGKISPDEAQKASDSVFSNVLGLGGVSELFLHLDTSRDSVLDTAELRAYLLELE